MSKVFQTCQMVSFLQLISDESINYGVYEGLLRATKNSSYLFYYDYIGANEHVPIMNDGQVGKYDT